MVMPSMVIGLPTPMSLVAKVAVALVVTRVTSSELCLPTRVAEVLTRRSVAFVEALYTRPFAVMPVTVSSLAVIVAVVAG